MADPLQIVKEMYAAFERNDIPMILSKLDASVVWTCEGPNEISFAGEREGVTQAKQFFEGIANDHSDPKLEMADFVADGESVAAFGRYRATRKATQKRIDSPVAHLFKFRGDKVIRYVNLANTAAFVDSKPAASTAKRAASPQKRAALNEFYAGGGPVAIAYLSMLAILVGGSLTHRLWPLWLAMALFTVWDLLWVLCTPLDRTAQEILESSARARTYMSYFVAVYGTALGYFLVRITTGEQAEFFTIVRSAGVPPVLLLLPLVLPAIAMLFFLIRLGEGEEGTSLAMKAATSANIASLLIAAWAQKVATFSFVYVVAMIGAFVSQSH